MGTNDLERMLPATRSSMPEAGRWLLRAVTVALCLWVTAIVSACRPTDGVTTASESTGRPLPSPQRTATGTVSFDQIRPAVVAGAFYPSDPSQVKALLERFLAPVPRLDGTPIALIVPHAGWVYSGHVAAFAYKQIEECAYDAIIIIGPNHTDPVFDAISVFAQGVFETPLGPIPIDEALAAEIVAADEQIVFDRRVHEQEHSIEVQLPFLQRVCPDHNFVPIIIGQPTPKNLAILTEALVGALQSKRALVIASSDLSHYPSYEDAITVDTRSLAAIETFDDDEVLAAMALQMDEGVPGLVTCACGQGPITVAMRVAQHLGADHVRVLRYANSGDVGGDRSQVVGYGAVMFWRWQPPMLTTDQQTELLAIARRQLESALTASGEAAASARASNLEPPADPVLNRRLGAFVTLTRNGELRGCIGHLQGDAPLYQTVAQAAVEAAVSDPRFPPLPLEQLDETELEISVLSPFRRVRDIHDESEIVVGRHGLYLTKGGQRGVLLPQVPVDEGWNRTQYLEQICLKAGLPTNCWERVTLYTFTAQVFDERRHD